MSERLHGEIEHPFLIGKARKAKFGILLALLLILSACSVGGSGGPGNAGGPGGPGGSGGSGGSGGGGTNGPPAVTGIFAIELPDANTTNANSYLIPEPNVAGEVVFVIWSAVDSGNGTLDWSSVESKIGPWWSGGKTTALVVWPVSDSSTIISTPAYVLAQLPPTVDCTLFKNIPEFTNSAFQSAYTAFLKSFFAKYGSDPRIAYIRVGLGAGGETYPACTVEQQQSYGLTESAWQTYVDGMLAVEHSNAGSVPLVVGLNCYGTPCPSNNPYAYPANVASLAAQYGIGLGQEGLQKSDMTNYQNSQPCTVNWCGFFQQYPNAPLHELQFSQPTCADNSCAIGSPIELLPFAKARGANVVELSIQDLSIAYVPPAGQYTAAYQQAIAAFY